jgi:hypothetical protein
VNACVLFWLGIGLELLGLALVAASDYVPLTRDLGRAGRRLASSAWWRPARVFGHRRTVYGKVELGGAIASGGHVTGVVKPGETASLEERVEFLLRQSVRTQEELAAIEHRVADLPAGWRRDIESAREDLERRIERRLTETQERYLLARRIGLVCLLAGVALVAASNL